MLFQLADKRKINDEEKKSVESILHGSGVLFLNKGIEESFTFSPAKEANDTSKMTASYDKTSLTLPADILSDDSIIYVEISGSGKYRIEDWKIKEVKRPKDSVKAGEFTATYTSAEAKDVKYDDGNTITVTVTPTAKNPSSTYVFKFKAVQSKLLGVAVPGQFTYERIS